MLIDRLAIREAIRTLWSIFHPRLDIRISILCKVTLGGWLLGGGCWVLLRLTKNGGSEMSPCEKLINIIISDWNSYEFITSV